MSTHLHEWLDLLLRWSHVLAAILWIGDSFLFMWMDASLEPSRRGREGDVSGEMWMTHSGGFYEVVKHRTLPALPERLHWFMWQSYSTWITGVLLLTVVFALGGRARLLDAGSGLPHGAAVAILYGALLAGLLVYEAVCRTGLRGHPLVAAGLALAGAEAWGLTRLLTPHAAFLLTGATLGTIMTANVFLVIIPGQARMLAAARAGRPADPADGARAKARSTHNHYLTLPVLAAMLSGHFPALWSGPHPWAVLVLVFAFGMGAKHLMNLRGRTPWPVTAGTLACLAGAFVLTLPPGPGPGTRALAGAAPVSDDAARAIVLARCTTCHAARPSNEAFTAPPAGVALDDVERMRAYADRIVYRVVETRSMPLGNLTGITEDERRTLGAWAWQQRHGANGR